jgi:putative membrane protein
MMQGYVTGNGPGLMYGEGYILLLGCAGILFLLLIITGAAMIIYSSMRGGKRDAKHHKNPLEIVQKRYAAGEIDREEYEQLKKDLSP